MHFTHIFSNPFYMKHPKTPKNSSKAQKSTVKTSTWLNNPRNQYVEKKVLQMVCFLSFEKKLKFLILISISNIFI